MYYFLLPKPIKGKRIVASRGMPRSGYISITVGEVHGKKLSNNAAPKGLNT